MASTSTMSVLHAAHSSRTEGTCRQHSGWFKYISCAPNEYLVKTGLGVKDMEVSKKTMIKPFQRVAVFDMNPRNYSFSLNNMSSEMVPFSLPVVFTIGPYHPSLDKDLFLKYASTMAGLSADELTQIVSGVVHGQTRVYTAGLTIKQMFEDRDKFKMSVQERIQKDMNQYGLHIYNANIAEMKDLDAHNKYFENLKQKALEGATTEARIQVAEARKLGDIGEKERQGDTTIQIAKVNANVAQQQNHRQQEMEQSKLLLELKKIECKRAEDMSRVDAEYATKQKQAELETSFQLLRAKQQVETQRGIQVSAAVVEAEAAVKKAEGEREAAERRAEAAYVTDTKKADAALYSENKKTDAVLYGETKKADALLYAETKKADAALYADVKKAEGMLKLRQAQAEGLKLVFDAVGNRPEVALQYLYLEAGLFERMAAQMANAVHGMNPKINVWSGASGSGGDADGMAPVSKLLTSLPPMLDVIAQQTDVKMPNWMPQVTAAAPAAAGVASQATTSKR